MGDRSRIWLIKSDGGAPTTKAHRAEEGGVVIPPRVVEFDLTNAERYRALEVDMDFPPSMPLGVYDIEVKVGDIAVASYDSGSAVGSTWNGPHGGLLIQGAMNVVKVDFLDNVGASTDFVGAESGAVLDAVAEDGGSYGGSQFRVRIVDTEQDQTTVDARLRSVDVQNDSAMRESRDVTLTETGADTYVSPHVILYSGQIEDSTLGYFENQGYILVPASRMIVQYVSVIFGTVAPRADLKVYKYLDGDRGEPRFVREKEENGDREFLGAEAGTVVYLNHDDDNGDGVVDKDEAALNVYEDDLEMLKIDLGAANLEEGTVVLRRTGPNIRVWSHQQKDGLQILFDNDNVQFDLSMQGDRDILNLVKDSLWIEGVVPTPGDRGYGEDPQPVELILEIKNAQGNVVSSDKVLIRVPEVVVLLTFDDGPEVTYGRTQSVIDDLRSPGYFHTRPGGDVFEQGNLKGVFFVISHDSPGAIVGAGSPAGESALIAAGADGHQVALHAVTWDTHNQTHPVRYGAAEYGVGSNGELPPGMGVPSSTALDVPAGATTALECDLIAETRRLRQILGPAYDPQYVRPPKWDARDSCERSIYSKLGAKEIQRDIWPADALYSDDMAAGRCYRHAQKAIARRYYHMVAVFHPRKSHVVGNLVYGSNLSNAKWDSYLDAMRRGATRMPGCWALRFVDAAAELHSILAPNGKQEWLQYGTGWFPPEGP